MEPKDPLRLGRALVLGSLGVLAVPLGGCWSAVNAETVYGVSHPTVDAHEVARTERRDGEAGRGPECRRVAVTEPMEHDVRIHRTFAAPEAQATNLAAFVLLGGSVAFLFYGSDQANCPDNGGGCGAVLASQIAMAGVAAVPLGFLIYNALRVRDTERVEPAEPERVEGPWGPCEEPGGSAPVEAAGPEGLDAGAVPPADGAAPEAAEAEALAPDGAPPAPPTR